MTLDTITAVIYLILTLLLLGVFIAIAHDMREPSYKRDYIIPLLVVLGLAAVLINI